MTLFTLFASCAALYTLACLLEWGRLARGGLTTGLGVAARRLAILGLFLQTIYLAIRIVQAIGERGMPLANWSDWCLIASWLLALAYVLLAHRRPGFGVFLLPIVLGLIGLTMLLPDHLVFQKAQTARLLGILHGMGLLLGTVTVLIGFSAGLMYLMQVHRLKHKVAPSSRFTLPSLEYLQRVNEICLLLSVFFLIGGMVTGIVLNLAIADRAGAPLPWSDPTILFSGLLVAWLAAAMVFASCYRPVKHTRKVAYLTVASFVALATTLGVVLFGPSVHTRSGSAVSQELRIEQLGDPSGQHVSSAARLSLARGGDRSCCS